MAALVYGPSLSFRQGQRCRHRLARADCAGRGPVYGKGAGSAIPAATILVARILFLVILIGRYDADLLNFSHAHDAWEWLIDYIYDCVLHDRRCALQLLSHLSWLGCAFSNCSFCGALLCNRFPFAECRACNGPLTRFRAHLAAFSLASSSAFASSCHPYPLPFWSLHYTEA